MTDARVESFLADVLALEGENPDAIREGVHVGLRDCEAIFKAQEVNRRMKDKAAHACHALCRARIVEDMRRRKGLSMGYASLKAIALVVRQHNIGASTVMTSTAEEKAFLRVAVAAIPRVTELILAFPPDDRAGALETAERRFIAAALDYGCAEITAQSRVSAVMRRLRRRLERQQASERNLKVLLQRLTEPG